MTDAESIRCGRCGGTLPLEAATRAVACPFCGTTAAPKPRVVEVERVVERVVVQQAPGARGTCPRCAEPLRETIAGGASFRACERCGGLWLDNATVERLSKSRDADVEDAARRAVGLVVHRIDTTPRIACPDCAKTMVRKELPESIHYLDVCPEHGTWFDYRELPMFISVFAERRAGELDANDLRAAGLPGSDAPSESDGSFFSDLFHSLKSALR